MAQRIVLIGAGSAQFGYGTIGDILSSKVLVGSTIVLHDINPETLAVVERTGKAFIAAHELPFEISATTSRTEALRGADVIIISIEVGNRFELWEEDWRVAQQYGIRQVYGENGGPGGLFHSLRIIPPILDICADVMNICPQATVFNYSNPMSRICTTVHRAYPELRFIGLCHEIASLRLLLPFILGLPYEQLEVRAAGLNHFSVVLSARYTADGRDAYPDIRNKGPQFFANMPSMGAVYKYFKETGQWPSETEILTSIEKEAWPERRVFQVMLEKFGLMPITSDSHFGEYIHWAYDVTDHRGILDFYRFYKRHLANIQPQIELRVNERVVPIIEGMLNNAGFVEEAVNIPNYGAIAELPDWIAVEVPAIVNAQGVQALKMSALPRGFAALLRNQVGVHDLTAEAVLRKSKEAALQALLVDPVVGQYHGLDELLDTMIQYQEPWLSYLR